MHFFKTAFVAALAVFSAPSVTALTAQEIVSNINSLTTKSQALQAPAQSITILNGPLIVVGLGPFPVTSLPLYHTRCTVSNRNMMP